MVGNSALEDALARRVDSAGACSIGLLQCLSLRVRIPDVERTRTADHQLGSDRGSPNHGSTLLSKRVTAQIRSPVRVRTRMPVP